MTVDVISGSDVEVSTGWGYVPHRASPLQEGQAIVDKRLVYGARVMDV